MDWAMLRSATATYTSICNSRMSTEPFKLISQMWKLTYVTTPLCSTENLIYRVQLKFCSQASSPSLDKSWLVCFPGALPNPWRNRLTKFFFLMAIRFPCSPRIKASSMSSLWLIQFLLLITSLSQWTARSLSMVRLLKAILLTQRCRFLSTASTVSKLSLRFSYQNIRWTQL